jgi:hypothetical protein
MVASTSVLLLHETDTGSNAIYEGRYLLGESFQFSFYMMATAGVWPHYCYAKPQ